MTNSNSQAGNDGTQDLGVLPEVLKSVLWLFTLASVGAIAAGIVKELWWLAIAGGVSLATLPFWVGFVDLISSARAIRRRLESGI